MGGGTLSTLGSSPTGQLVMTDVHKNSKHGHTIVNHIKRKIDIYVTMRTLEHTGCHDLLFMRLSENLSPSLYGQTNL